MSDKKHFLTVFSVKRGYRFGQLTGVVNIIYTTYTIYNGIPIKEGSGVLKQEDCPNFKEYITVLYKDFAKSHTIEKL